MIWKNTLKLLSQLSVFFISLTLYSQFSTLESYGTKSNSLATITTTFKDIDASYTNQAGLAFLQNMEMNISYENRFLSLDLSAINFAVAKNFSRIGTFALSIKKFGISEFNEFLFGLAYARKIGKNTGLAIQLNGYHLNIDKYGNKNAIGFETGIIHDFSDDFTLGFHVSNPFPINYIDDTNIPTIIALGGIYRVSDNVNFFGEIEKHIDYGIFVKTALEYSPLNIFSISLGYKNDFNGFADYSMGFMYVSNNKIKINLATIYNLTLGLSPSIGLTYAINNKL